MLFFSMLSQWDKKLKLLFECIFEEIVPKLSVNFENCNSQDFPKNQYPGPVLNFGFTHHDTAIYVDKICGWSAVSLPLVKYT